MAEPWHITTVQMNDEIQVTFSSYLYSKTYEIRLRRQTDILDATEVEAVRCALVLSN